MKKLFKFSMWAMAAMVMPTLSSCSDNDDCHDCEPDDFQTVTIGFNNVPSYLIGGPDSYGSNLYYGAQDQITTGYLTQIDGDTYAQFSINYGYTYDLDYNMVWGYSFFNGGLAVSDWHDMEDNSYSNQLSVYNTSSPSGGNFVVAFSSSTQESINGKTLSDFSGCARVYITDAKGYYAKKPGTDTSLTGEDKEAFFKSVYINNTTYDFLTMKNGNPYASALNQENEGWFKVQFIAFEDDDPDEKPVGYTEAYLANFKKGQADDYMGIVDEWIKVDLSMLPECSVLVINFDGSDKGEYGLNTPCYCALDKFEISVEK